MYLSNSSGRKNELPRLEDRVSPNGLSKTPTGGDFSSGSFVSLGSRMDVQQHHFGQGNSDAAGQTFRHDDSLRPWMIEQDYECTGRYHMERDEALALERAGHAALPNVLRLYSWQPSAVSIGFQQKMESVDLEACQKAGIDVVRRPTGGRAVLHANELTYAAIVRVRPESGIYATHNHIIEALLASLADLGPEYLTMTLTERHSERNFREVYKAGALTNAACFASSARHEVTFQGRKVIGSAQRRFGEVILQHGSILLCGDHLKLPDLLVLPDEQRAAMHALLRNETATLSDVFGRPIIAQEAATSIRNGFAKHYSGHHRLNLI